MKKYVFVITFVVISVFSAVGQEKPFLLGFKFSPAVNWYKANSSGLEGGNPGFDFSGGVIADIRLVGNYFFETGLFYDFQSGNLSYNSEYHNVIGKLSRNYHVQYFEIPLSLKMCTNHFGRLRFFGLAGFKSSFRIAASSDDVWTIGNTSKSIGKQGASDDFALFKESLFFGLGTDIFFDKSTHVTIGINYTTSLSNAAGSDMKCYFDGTWEKAKFSNNILELRLGIMF